MKVAAVLGLGLVIVACGSSFSAVPIRAGDICAGCGKQINDVRFAAEAITTQGEVMRFRTPKCLATYVRRHPEAVASKFVTDYVSGRFIRPESATYVRTVLDENTREAAHAAFAQVSDAVKFGKANLSSPIDWLMIQRASAETKSN